MHKIHKIHKMLFSKFRAKRWLTFIEEINPTPSDSIIDIGGAWYTWTNDPNSRGHVLCINKENFSYQLSDDKSRSLNVSYECGDALALRFEDKSFSIAYSNSVIEHVGNFEAQRKFAEEILRVGRKVWVQTPSREFIVEPHYMTLGVHWLPPNLQKKILRWFSLWGWVQKPDAEYIDKLVNEIRLLKRHEMEELFPDCRILEEKFLGIFTKSYIAIRD